MSFSPAEVRILRLAGPQYGVFSLRQALESRLDRMTISRRVRGGRWEEVLPRVYRVSGGGEGSWEQRAMAATLWGGEGAVLSHASAARVWGLDRPFREPPIEISIPLTRARRGTPIRVHRARDLLPQDLRKRDRLPVTSRCRTVLDLAAVLDEGPLEVLLEEALRRHLDLDHLQRRLAQLRTPGRRGLRLLASLLARRGEEASPLDSRLETRLLQLIRTAGLPTPERHFVVTRDEWMGGEVDFAYPRIQVAIEVDGPHHQSRRQWTRDQDRNSALAALGWRVLHVTADALRGDPDRVVNWIRLALSADAQPRRRRR